MNNKDIKLYVDNFKKYVDNLSENELQNYIDKFEKQNKTQKSAKEMFEELGYTYQESYFEEKLDEINYSKSGDYAPQIIFNFNHKCVMVYRKENKASWFDMKILQAINQQINELGWK